MAQYTLTVVDTCGIQDYVFSSNNLQQIVGASYLVNCVTRDWAIWALPYPNNIKEPFDESDPYTSAKIEDGQIKAEAIYSGGGNFVAIFKDIDDAKAFTQKLTAHALQQAPGLRIVVAHEEFEWDAKASAGEALGSKQGVVSKVFSKLLMKKANSPAVMPLLGMGITAECAFTGFPAVSTDTHGRLLSAEAEAKYAHHEDGNQRLKDYLQFGGYDEPSDNLDELGQTTGEKSYIAVVHTDGNGMGKRIEAIRDRYSQVAQNRLYLDNIRAYSLGIERAAKEALQETLDCLLFNIEEDRKNSTQNIPIHGQQVPFRPIVFGGDDITFISEGRLGLSLAREYLSHLSHQALPDEQKIGCRAGVAVVKTHYPVARAYMLAEELCKSAKALITKMTEQTIDKLGFEAPQISAIDWHFAVNGMITDLDTIRKREYQGATGSLLMRPLTVFTEPTILSPDIEDRWRSWENFSQITQQFAGTEEFVNRRNRVKALREALRQNPASISQFLKNYEFRLPGIPEYPGVEKNGWVNNRSGYFDAVEAIDFYIPLKSSPIVNNGRD